MDWFPADALLVGRDERAAKRFLLLAVGVAASTLGVLTIGQPLWQGAIDAGHTVFFFAYLTGTVSVASVYAFRNDGLLVTLFGTVVLLLGVFVSSRLNAVCGVGGVVGCPTTLLGKVLLGALLAAGVAVPLGSTAFAVGAGGRRLLESRATSP